MRDFSEGVLRASARASAHEHHPVIPVGVHPSGWARSDAHQEANRPRSEGAFTSCMNEKESRLWEIECAPAPCSCRKHWRKGQRMHEDFPPFRGSEAFRALEALGEGRIGRSMHYNMTAEETATFAVSVGEAADRIERKHGDGTLKPRGQGRDGYWDEDRWEWIWEDHSTFEEAVAAIREAAHWYSTVAGRGLGVRSHWTRPKSLRRQGLRVSQEAAAAAEAAKVESERVEQQCLALVAPMSVVPMDAALPTDSRTTIGPPCPQAEP